MSFVDLALEVEPQLVVELALDGAAPEEARSR